MFSRAPKRCAAAWEWDGVDIDESGIAALGYIKRLSQGAIGNEEATAMSQIMGLKVHGNTSRGVLNAILKYKDLYCKLGRRIDPLWAETALRRTIIEDSGTKARELAGPMFALHDTNEEWIRHTLH